MTIATGDRLPAATFLEKGADGIAAGRRARRSSPGAGSCSSRCRAPITGICSTQHVPSFIRVARRAAGEGRRRDRLRRGERPARDAGLGRGDRRAARRASACWRTPASEFTRALGMDFDNPARGHVRAARSATRMLVEDGVVRGPQPRGEHRAVRDQRRRDAARRALTGPCPGDATLPPAAPAGQDFLRRRGFGRRRTWGPSRLISKRPVASTRSLSLPWPKVRVSNSGERLVSRWPTVPSWNQPSASSSSCSSALPISSTASSIGRSADFAGARAAGLGGEVLGEDEAGAGLAEALRGLGLADAVDVDPLLADAGGEPGEVAVRGDQAEAVEAAGMQEVHGVDDQRDVGRVLAGGVGELLLGEDGVAGEHPLPAGTAGPWRSRRRCAAGSPRRSWPPRRRGRRRSWARCCRRRSAPRAWGCARASAQSARSCAVAKPSGVMPAELW